MGPLASQAVVDWVRDLTVAGTITDGLLVASLESPFESQAIRFDTVAFANQGASTMTMADTLAVGPHLGLKGQDGDLQV